jgi:ribonuclease P protein component
MDAHDQRFGKRDRLRQRREFLELDQRGRRISHPCFIVRMAPAPSDRSRLGLTVSRRVGNAVARNRIKRRLRELFRRQRSSWTGAWDVNIIARRGAGELTYAETASVLQRMFSSCIVRSLRSSVSS